MIKEVIRMNKSKFSKSMIDKYELLFDASPLGICITEIDGSINVNNTFCKMLGYTRNELLDSGWKEITYKDDIQKHHEIFDIYSSENKETKTVEKRFVKKDGKVIWTEVTSKIKNDEHGNPDFLVSMIRDISEYKNVQNELVKNESRYKELFDNNPNPMWLYNIETLKFLIVNKAAVANYGYSIEEFLNMTIKDIRPPEDVPKLINHLSHIDSALSESDTWRHRKKDGTIILVKISAHTIGYNGSTARVITSIDVTEKVVAKQNLVTEVAKLKSIIESTSDLIFSLDRRYCYTSFNTAHTLFMKNLYNADIGLGKSVLDYKSVDEDRELAKANIDKALKGERVKEISIFGEEFFTKRYFEILYNPIKDENGKVIGVSVFAKDITETKRAAAKLEQQEKEFHSLFNEALTGDFISTAGGKIIVCNPKFLKIFNFESKEEAYNVPVELLYRNQAERSDILERVKNEGKIENFELEMVTRDGKDIYILGNIVGQFDDEGKLEKIIGYLSDITEQKATFDKVLQLSKAVEQSPVTIIVTDTDGNIQYINQKGVEVTGFSLEEIIGKNPSIFSSGKMKKEDYKELWNKVKSGNEWRGEFHNKKKNGELYWEFASISPIKNDKGQTTNFLAIKEDITDRKKNVQELIAAKEKAEEINKIKSVFFCNLSHELRTPLVAILGFADILSSTLEDESEQSMALSILQGGKRLLNTLTSLLNLSELESLKDNIKLNQLDINILCKDLMKQRRLNTKKSNVNYINEFEEESLVINSNSRMIREALEHLLNNAEIFTEEGFIILKTYKKNLPELGAKLGVIQIIDTGIGIPIEKLNVVFEEFRQASEGFSRKFDGIGLGLTLTKKYVELMGGSISVESQLGRGTKFTISFPISEQAQINIENFGIEIENKRGSKKYQ